MMPGGLLPWDLLDDMAARVAEFGWHVQLQLDGRLLPEKRAQIERLPGRIVIDHTGKFLEPVPVGDPAFKVLQGIVDSGRCWVKLSAPYETSKVGPPVYDDVGALASALIRQAPGTVPVGDQLAAPVETGRSARRFASRRPVRRLVRERGGATAHPRRHAGRGVRLPRRLTGGTARAWRDACDAPLPATAVTPLQSPLGKPPFMSVATGAGMSVGTRNVHHPPGGFRRDDQTAAHRMTATGHAHTPDGMTACHECDALHRLRALAPGAIALCTRCGAELYREPRGGVDRPLALSLAALGLFVLANVFPFIALKLEGRLEENLLVSGVLAMWREGMPDLAALVFLTSVLFPLLTVLALLWLLVPARFGRRAPWSREVYGMLHAIGPWTLPGVFMLGALIAFVKLMDIATVIPGVSMLALAALIVTATAAAASFDTVLLWPRIGPPVPGGAFPTTQEAPTATDLGLAGCHTCELLFERRLGHCPRCGSHVHAHRKSDSLARTWALVVSALL
ncbi:MAG: paraquat-inducible protein A, partial [Planctomycetes bacterium]|nr:paraquat-inducible protein A [Planctomycetota bacterium]